MASGVRDRTRIELGNSAYISGQTAIHMRRDHYTKNLHPYYNINIIIVDLLLCVEVGCLRPKPEER